MALLTVSTESALTEAGNSVLTASVFHGLVANFGFCACVLYVTRHSMLAGNSVLAGKRRIVGPVDVGQPLHLIKCSSCFPPTQYHA